MNRDDFTERIRDATDFPSLVAETIALPRQPQGGRPVMAYCPFHDDRATKSLAVYSDHAHCFGACNETWDCFGWLMKRDGLTFPQARDELARRAGIPKPHWTPEQEAAAQERREYEDALGRAACHFASHLQETSTALEYAHERAWSDEAIRAEGVGYANGSSLPNLNNPKAQHVVEALNRWSGKAGGAIVYAHREASRVTYLAGRSLEGKHHYNPPADLAGPKQPYVSALYSARAEELAIVEGQADAITLTTWGIPALGLAGSGLTGDLANRLNRHNERGATVYVVPDGDGNTDMSGLAEAVGPLLRAAMLPDGVADANAYAQDGATAEDFRTLLDAAPTCLDLQIKGAAQAQGAARDRAIENLFPLLAQLPPITLARYKSRVTKALEEIGARDFDRLLKAVQNAEADERAPADLVEGKYPVLSPALDFIDDLAIVTIPLLVQSSNTVDRRPYLVTSTRELIPADGSQVINIEGRRIILDNPPTVLGSTTRWEYADVKAFLDGNVPTAVEVYLECERLYDRYIDFREEGTSDVLALWVIGTHLYRLFETFPYIGLPGPLGSGKTKTIDLTRRLAFNMRVSSNMSSAALFRVVEATKGALGIDEAERLANSHDPVVADLRLLLNAGYKRGAPAIRIEGDDHRVAEFSVFGPKMIASIRGFEDVLESRCILIPMLRTMTGKGNLVISDTGEDWSRVRHGLYSLALTHFAEIREIYLGGVGSEGLTNRQAELWRPLLAIAAFLDRQGAEGLLELVKAYARRKADNAQAAGLGEWEEALLLALEDMTRAEGQATLSAKEIRDKMAELLEVGDELRASWVGYAVKRLGLLPNKNRKTRTSAGRMAYIIIHDEVREIMQRYDVQSLTFDNEKTGSSGNPSESSNPSEPFRAFREAQTSLLPEESEGF